LTWNVLNYGRLLINIRIQDARFQQLARAYEQQVLVANQEVEDAIIRYFKSRERVEYLTTAVNAAERLSKLVLKVFTEGRSDYNRVINVLSTLVVQQDSRKRPATLRYISSRSTAPLAADGRFATASTARRTVKGATVSDSAASTITA